MCHPSGITVAKKSNGCDCINLSKFNNNIPRYLFLHIICIKWDRIQEYGNLNLLASFPCQNSLGTIVRVPIYILIL